MQHIVSSQDYDWNDGSGPRHSQPRSQYTNTQQLFSADQTWAMQPFLGDTFDYSSVQPSLLTNPDFSGDPFHGSAYPTESSPVNHFLTAPFQDTIASFADTFPHAGGLFNEQITRHSSFYTGGVGTPSSAATSSMRSTPDPNPAGPFSPPLFVSSPTASDDGNGIVDIISSRRASEYESRRKSPLARTKKGKSSARLPGACVRCKRLKMKCTFLDQTSDCIRCESGRHECVVEGRKPRTPGQREQLLRQIRAKNEAITEGLRGLRWGAQSSTPLMIAPAHLPLAPQDREHHRDVLAWLDKRPSPGRAIERACMPIDTSELEDEEMRSDDEDDEDGAPEGSVSASPASDTVLAQPLALRDDLTPLGFMSKWSRKFAQSTTLLASPNAGICSSEFFQPSPYADLGIRRVIIERELVPDVLLSGLITTMEARILFDLFFQHLNPYLNVLDEAIHNAASVMRRSPFLFTVVCAVASRYYTTRPGIYKIAIHMAKASAASAVIDGFKSVESCQAFLIFAAYGSPVSRNEESRGRLYSGIATRMAVELGLDKAPVLPCDDERSEREVLNKVRTWIACWVLESMMSLESGRVPDIPEDFIIRNSARFCSSSKYHTDFDTNFPVFIELFRVMRRFWESTAAYKEGSSQVDLSMLVSSFDAALSATMASQAVSTTAAGRASSANAFNAQISGFLLNDCRFLIFWFAHQAELSFPGDSAQYLYKTIDAACTLIQTWTDGLAKQSYARHAPDVFFTGTGFACTFALQLLHPNQRIRVSDEQKANIISAVQATARRLASTDVPVDASHVSRQYATFLENAMSSLTTL